MDKICFTCKMPKSAENYSKSKSNTDGLCGSCKGCMSDHLKRWRRANPDKMKASLKEYLKWKIAHPEKAIISRKKAMTEISDSYIAAQVKMPVRKLRLNPELIMEKRKQILNHRKTRSQKSDCITNK